MGNVWEITLAIIASVGGAGVIIAGIVALCTNIITNRIEQRYAQILSKELEKYKSNLSKKEYVSKTRFDAEFEIHRSLSKAFFDLVVAINTMIPDGMATVPADPDCRKKFEDESHSLAHTATVVAQNVLNQNAPFILKEYYTDYTELLDLSRKQLDAFSQRYNVGYLASPEEKKELSFDDYRRTGELIKKLDILNDKIRSYLKSLEVAE
jgi:hypothetical protein